LRSSILVNLLTIIRISLFGQVGCRRPLKGAKRRNIQSSLQPLYLGCCIFN
jgi:hypothetical protein